MNSQWTKIMFPVLLICSPSFCTAQDHGVQMSTLDFRDQPHLSFDAIYNDFYPKLMKVFDPVYLNISENTHYDAYLTHMGLREEKRPRFIHIKIVSHKFDPVATEDRHAMVHEALRDEMMKREAGCAIDIHADTPEEWNEFRANNDFDEVSGKPDLRARAAKTTPITLKDTKLREKIYKYLKLHFKPTILHVVDSKHMHPVDNDNPAFDVLLVSLHFSNLTITQRTMMMHDYLRDFINEGIQFRLHLDPPDEYVPKNVDLFLGDYTLEPTERDRSI